MPIPFRERGGCSIREAGEFGGWGRSTTYELIKEGKLKTFKRGKRQIVCVPSLLELVEPLAERPP
jgi:hypothetical protein